MPHGRREARESELYPHGRARRGPPPPARWTRRLAQIGAAFDEGAAIIDLKLRVDLRCAAGRTSGSARAVWRARRTARRFDFLDGAVATVERWWRGDAKRFRSQARLAMATGCRSTCCGS